MARDKITIKRLEQLRPGDVVWDSTLQGFGARCQSQGTVSYVLKYRMSGRQRMHTIGTFAQLKPEQARDAAIVFRGQIAKGSDPGDRKSEARAERIRKKEQVVTSFEKVARSYVKRVAKPNLRAAREVERIFERYVIPAWTGKPVAEITRRNVTELLDKIEDRNGKVMADRVLAQVRRLFNWWAARDDQFRSPIVRGMARVRPRDIARDRVLSDDELRALWKVTEPTAKPSDNSLPNDPKVTSAADVFGSLVRFLLLTAQRRDEAAQAKWAEIDGDVWTIPSARYKTKVANAVPLSDAAKCVLAGLVRNCEHVFSTLGRKPFSGFSKAKKTLDAGMLAHLREIASEQGQDPEEATLSSWRLQDLRRTARTLMSRAGVRPEIAERVLGHTISGVAGVYDRHSYIEEKRDALEKLDATIKRIVSSRSDNIIQIASRL